MTDPRQPPLISRVAWFVALWVAGVLAVGAIAYGIRLLLLVDPMMK